MFDRVFRPHRPGGCLRVRFLALACALACTPLAAGAQTNAEANAGVQFNFSSPGARSLALGGAFVGLADDATAASTNPAGLLNLPRPEISLEGRAWAMTSVFTDRGRASDAPTQYGIDTIAGLVDGTSTRHTQGPSFMSFVYPGGRWAVAGYRQVVADFRADYRTAGAFLYSTPPATILDEFDCQFLLGGSSPVICNAFRLLPVHATLDLGIVNYGGAIAARLSDSLSVGVSAAYSTFELRSETRRYASENGTAEHPFFFNGPPFGDGTLFGAPLYTADALHNTQTLDGSDGDLVVNVGVQWRVSDELSVGATFRQGGDFEFEARDVVDVTDTPRPLLTPGPSMFRVPHVFATGFALRPTPAATLAVDYTFVQYSRLVDDMTLFSISDPDLTSANFAVDDAHEIHIGFEYVLSAPRPVAIRLGAWRDPDHRVRANEASFNPTGDGALFRPGEDAFHVTAGLGLVFGRRFQIDGAFDGSERTRVFSLSTVVRF